MPVAQRIDRPPDHSGAVGRLGNLLAGRLDFRQPPIRVVLVKLLGEGAEPYLPLVEPRDKGNELRQGAAQPIQPPDYKGIAITEMV